MLRPSGLLICHRAHMHWGLIFVFLLFVLEGEAEFCSLYSSEETLQLKLQSQADRGLSRRIYVATRRPLAGFLERLTGSGTSLWQAGMLSKVGAIS